MFKLHGFPRTFYLCMKTKSIVKRQSQTTYERVVAVRMTFIEKL